MWQRQIDLAPLGHSQTAPVCVRSILRQQAVEKRWICPRGKLCDSLDPLRSHLVYTVTVEQGSVRGTCAQESQTLNDQTEKTDGDWDAEENLTVIFSVFVYLLFDCSISRSIISPIKQTVRLCSTLLNNMQRVRRRFHTTFVICMINSISPDRPTHPHTDPGLGWNKWLRD